MAPETSVVCVTWPFISKERKGKLFATTKSTAAASASASVRSRPLRGRRRSTPAAAPAARRPALRDLAEAVQQIAVLAGDEPDDRPPCSEPAGRA